MVKLFPTPTTTIETTSTRQQNKATQQCKRHEVPVRRLQRSNWRQGGHRGGWGDSAWLARSRRRTSCHDHDGDGVDGDYDDDIDDEEEEEKENKYGYYLRMQKTAAQMQSIKRAVEETAMFSASILPTRCWWPTLRRWWDWNKKLGLHSRLSRQRGWLQYDGLRVYSKIKDKRSKRSRAVSKSPPQPRPAVQMTNTEALAVLRALHGEPKIIRAKCSFRKTQKNKDRNYVDGGFK